MLCVLVMSVTGGATRSEVWLQMHADVTGVCVQVGLTDNAAVLGSAVLAMVGATANSDHPISIHEAAAKMVRLGRRVFPNPEMKPVYDKLYQRYQRLAPALSEVFHSTPS